VPKTDNVRQVDLPRATGGGPVYIRGGGAGGVSNADTVDGYHASSTPTAGKLLALNSSAQFNPSVIEWADVAGAGLSASGDTLVVQWGTTPTTIQPDDAAAGGSAATSARSDHRHAIATAVPGTILPDDSANEGSATSFARSDHRHAIAAAAPTSNLSVTSANAEGDATSFARSNHTHAITSSANPGAAASILASSAQGYLQLVRLGLGVAPSYPLHIQGTTPQLRLQQDAGNYADFEVDGGGDLSLKPSGDSLLVPGTKTLASHDWASQTTGWAIYPESTHGRSGYADFRYIYADELHVKAFVTDLEQALAGGQIISKSVAIIAEDFTIPAKGDGAVLTVEDLPGTTAWAFANGDWVRIRNISRSGGGLVVADAYGTVTQVSQNGDGTQTYTFTRAAADTGSAVAGTVVQKGGLVLDYGVSGNGYWEVTTLDPAGSPYAQVATWAGHPQNLTVRARLGNLDGIAGIGAEWGLWAGKDSNHWIKVSDAGAEIKGLKQTWIDAGGNTRGMVDPQAGAGDYLFWLGPSSGNKRFGVTGDGTVYIGNVPSQNVAGWAHASDLTKIDGGDIYAGSVTAAQMSVTGFNLVDNPGFEYWSSTTAANGWVLHADAVRASSTVHSGTYCIAVPGTGAAKSVARQDIPVTAGASYYLEGWVHLSSPASGITRDVHWIAVELDAAGMIIAGTYHNPTEGNTIPKGVWRRQTCLFTTASNCAKVRVYLYVGADLVAGEYARGDDVSLRAASGMNLLVGTPGSARVEINNAGIEGRDSANAVQFQIRTDNGRATFGAGHGVLDASGLKLDGNQTSIQDYASVVWRTDPANSASTEIARISSGRFYEIFEANAWVPHLYMAANRANAYIFSKVELVGYGGASNTYNQLLLDHGWGYSSASLRTVYEGSTRAEVVVSRDQFNFGWVQANIEGTSRLQVYRDGIQVTGRIGIGTPPSYPLHIQTGDLVPIYIRHTGTAPRVLTTILRNTTDTGWLEWHQQFGSGDTPAWQFVRVNRPDGSGAGFLTALSIGWNGDVYVAGTLSAEGLIDRTPYPDRDTALAAVRSLRQAEGKVGSLDHEALHEYVRARNKSGETGRNLSATVSAQNVVIQELLRRIELLEKDRRVS
jgi:hypothetical protein